MKLFRMQSILVCHTCAPYQLELVDFQSGQRQTGHQRSLPDQLVTLLPGQPEDDMPTSPYACIRRTPDGFLRLGKRMPAIDADKRPVVHTLYPVLYHQESTAVQSGQIIQQRLRHTVGTRADDYSHHIRHSQSFFILPDNLIYFSIRIRISLEISQKLHIRILSFEKAFAFLQLLRNRFLRTAIGRIKCLVVAISTSAPAFFPITVRASKTRIDGNLLYFERKFPTQEFSVVCI